MAKFTFGKPATKRVVAGGAYSDDWFDVKTSGITQGDLLAVNSAPNDNERGMRLVYSLIAAWSFTDDGGKPVAVSWDAFCALPLEIAQPLYEEVKSLDFLARQSPPKNPES